MTGIRLTSIIMMSAIVFLFHGLPVSAQADDKHILKSDSFDTLAGPLPSLVKFKPNPYFVVGDIEVPASKTVTIEPGAIFLFKSFTGLHVRGKLIANGTALQPIVFTTVKDQTVNPATQLFPNPYDWNGIYLHADAFGSSMTFCNVLYSVYGIVSETKFIRLDTVALVQNGKGNLTIGEEEWPIADSLYSYAIPVKDGMLDGKIVMDPLSLKRSLVRYAGLGVALAGVGGGLYYAMQWKKNQDDLVAKSNNAVPSLRQLGNEAPWAKAQKSRDASILYTGIGGLATILGCIGFYWSFTF